MDRVIRDSGFRIDTGRASSGTFVRVIHEPTDNSRLAAPLGSRAYSEVVAELRSLVEGELVVRGWVLAEKKSPA